MVRKMRYHLDVAKEIQKALPEDKLREDIEKRVKAKPIVSELLND